MNNSYNETKDLVYLSDFWLDIINNAIETEPKNQIFIVTTTFSFKIIFCFIFLYKSHFLNENKTFSILK